LILYNIKSNHTHPNLPRDRRRICNVSAVVYFSHCFTGRNWFAIILIFKVSVCERSSWGGHKIEIFFRDTRSYTKIFFSLAWFRKMRQIARKSLAQNFSMTSRLLCRRHLFQQADPAYANSLFFWFLTGHHPSTPNLEEWVKLWKKCFS
jgi:hypothetical protein